MQNLPQTFVYVKEWSHLEVEGEPKVVCYDVVLLILHSLHVLRCSFVTVLLFLSRLCHLSLPAPRHPSLTHTSRPAPDWPHTFTSSNTWMYGAHLVHLTSPSHTHPQSAKNVFFPPPHPSLPIANHTSYRIMTQLPRAYHIVPASFSTSSHS